MLFEQSTAVHDFSALDTGAMTSHPDRESNAHSSSPSEGDASSYQSLKRQSLRLERLLQVMPAGVIVIDGKGIVRQANNLARELLGEPLEEQVWREIIRRSFSPRADDGHEVSLHDGRRVKLSITPLIEEPGQLIVITDLTETRQLQARVSHMQRLSSLGKMVASLAHQIRTPLSAALLYAANLTQDSVQPALQSKFARKLLERLQDLESQVNDMLLFAKSGEQQVVSSVQVSDLLSEVEQSCSSLVERAGVNLSIVEDGTVGTATILANSTALRGALVNLIDNAVQVSKRGDTISFCAELSPDLQSIVLRCIDQGPGIPHQNIKRLFEPFFTTKTNGTGLGLAVVQQAVRAHKGVIDVRNLKVGGAEFVICLPIETNPKSAVEVAPLAHSVEV